MTLIVLNFLQILRKLLFYDKRSILNLYTVGFMKVVPSVFFPWAHTEGNHIQDTHVTFLTYHNQCHFWSRHFFLQRGDLFCFEIRKRFKGRPVRNDFRENYRTAVPYTRLGPQHLAKLYVQSKEFKT